MTALPEQPAAETRLPAGGLDRPMLAFDRVVLHEGRRGSSPLLFDNLTFAMARRRALVLGRTPDHAQAFMALCAGVRQPQAGQVHTTGRVSWPLGSAATFRSNLSGSETISFLSQAFHLDQAACLRDASQYFSRKALDAKLTAWTGQDRLKLDRIAALWPAFDLFLLHDVKPLGDAEFDAHWLGRFDAHSESAALLVASQDYDSWAERTDCALLVGPTEVEPFADAFDAIAAGAAQGVTAMPEQDDQPVPDTDNDPGLF